MSQLDIRNQCTAVVWGAENMGFSPPTGYTKNRKTMTEINIDDLREPCYMSLSSPPASPEAKRLVEDIINIITKSEKRQRARKSTKVPVFKFAVGLIIEDLLIGFHTR